MITAELGASRGIESPTQLLPKAEMGTAQTGVTCDQDQHRCCRSHPQGGEASSDPHQLADPRAPRHRVDR